MPFVDFTVNDSLTVILRNELSQDPLSYSGLSDILALKRQKVDRVIDAEGAPPYAPVGQPLTFKCQW